MAGGMGWVSLHAELGCPGSAEPQLGEFFPSLLECGRIFSGFEMREVVGDFMEAPSWGSAFPGGWYAMSLQGIKA